MGAFCYGEKSFSFPSSSFVRGWIRARIRDDNCFLAWLLRFRLMPWDIYNRARFDRSRSLLIRFSDNIVGLVIALKLNLFRWTRYYTSVYVLAGADYFYTKTLAIFGNDVVLFVYLRYYCEKNVFYFYHEFYICKQLIILMRPQFSRQKYNRLTLGANDFHELIILSDIKDEVSNNAHTFASL